MISARAPIFARKETPAAASPDGSQSVGLSESLPILSAAFARVALGGGQSCTSGVRVRLATPIARRPSLPTAKTVWSAARMLSAGCPTWQRRGGRSGCCPRNLRVVQSRRKLFVTSTMGGHCPRSGMQYRQRTSGRRSTTHGTAKSVRLQSRRQDAPGRAQFGVTLQGYDVETGCLSDHRSLLRKGFPVTSASTLGLLASSSGFAPSLRIRAGAGKDVPRQRLLRRFTARMEADRNGGDGANRAPVDAKTGRPSVDH